MSEPVESVVTALQIDGAPSAPAPVTLDSALHDGCELAKLAARDGDFMMAAAILERLASVLIRLAAAARETAP